MIYNTSLEHTRDDPKKQASKQANFLANQQNAMPLAVQYKYINSNMTEMNKNKY